MNVKVSPRPRDFYDIYTILEKNETLKADLLSSESRELITDIFKIKSSSHFTGTYKIRRH